VVSLELGRFLGNTLGQRQHARATRRTPGGIVLLVGIAITAQLV
jgi:hypothetical protein